MEEARTPGCDVSPAILRDYLPDGYVSVTCPFCVKTLKAFGLSLQNGKRCPSCPAIFYHMRVYRAPRFREATV